MSEEEYQPCERGAKKKIDFSIEGILREPYLSKLTCNDDREQTVVKVGDEDFSRRGTGEKMDEDSGDIKSYSWLYCSRFKPPKLPRSKKRNSRKRYGRGPRIPFAAHQIAVLENAFSKSHYLSPDCIARLADSLFLNETRVKIWFQNRRARYRREQELMSLGSGNDKKAESTEIPEDSSSHPDPKYIQKLKVGSESVNSVVSDHGEYGQFRVIHSPSQLSESYQVSKPKYTAANEIFPGQLLKFENPVDFQAERFCAPYYNRIILGGSCSAFVPLFRR